MCDCLFFVGGVCGKNYNSIGIVNFNIAAKGDIKMLEHQVKVNADATGLAGHRAHIVRREAWHKASLSQA